MRALVIDTETTGIDCKVDTVLELAGVDPFGSYQYETLCYWPGEIPCEAKAVHHLTEEEVSNPNLPTFGRAVKDMLAGCVPDYMIAHNAPFDRGFFEAEGFEPGAVRWIDTLRCAKHLIPEAPGFSNQVLRYYLKLDVGVPEGLAPHRALYDTIVTAELFLHLYYMTPVPTLEEKEAHQLRLSEMHRMSSAPAILHRLTFGKHRGKLFSEVRRTDPGYLRWMSTAADIDPDAKHTAQTLLRSR